MTKTNTTETATGRQKSEAKEWYVYRRQKRDGKIALVGNGEPLTYAEAAQVHWSNTGCVGERFNSYFIHKGMIAE